MWRLARGVEHALDVRFSGPQHLDVRKHQQTAACWGMSRAELEKRILRLHKGGIGILKIGKTLGIGTGTVQRVLMEQPRPFRGRRR
jgi:hypothetical protein